MATSNSTAYSKLGFAAPRIGSKETIYATAGPPPSFNKMRLSSSPGAPKLRAAGSTYKKTGFSRPVMASVKGVDALPLRVLKSETPMPSNFCWQPQDLTATLDQGSCGSCWAHATATILGDRVSVQTNGSVRTALSIQQIMECSEYLKDVQPVGCEGNEIYIALSSLVKSGTKLNAHGQYVRKYTASPCNTGSCSSSPDTKYFVTVANAFLISEPIKAPGDDANKRNIENMKQHIYFEGPIIGTLLIYSDFMDYDGKTIYEPSAALIGSSTEPKGAHAIEIIGWGKDSSGTVDYWVCRNSWGNKWPSTHKECIGTGTFYIRMGNNTCEIEAWCAGAHPTPHGIEKAPKDAGGMYPGEAACSPNNWDNTHTISKTTKPMHKAIIGIALSLVVLIGIGIVAHHYMKKRKR